MNNPFAGDVPMLEQARIVADVLIPVLRAFRAELGAERANAIAARGLAAWHLTTARSAGERLVGAPRDKWEKAAGDALARVSEVVDVEQLEQGGEALSFAVGACRLAELFRALGEPELGYHLFCACDQAQVRAIAGEEVVLEREATLMEGAPRCDFRYRFHGDGGGR